MMVPISSSTFGWRIRDIMDADSIIAAIDAEIAILHQARALLSDDLKKVSNANKGRLAKVRTAARRMLSPDARKRISDAQRKRWAASRKLKKAAANPAPVKAARKTAATKKAKPEKTSARRMIQVKPKKLASKKAIPAKTESSNTSSVPS